MLDSRRILIVTWEGGGNVPPALALGQRLAMAGHHVTVLGTASLGSGGPRLRAESYVSVPVLAADQTFDDQQDLFREVLNGQGAAQDVVEVASREHPDVLVVDCMMGAAFAAADYLGLPTVVLVHVLYRPFVDLWGQFVLDAAASRGALDLPASPSSAPADVLASADLVLALTPRSFDFDGADPPANTHYVGPIVSPASPEPLDLAASGSDPLVLISYSTTLQGQHRGLPPVLEALGTLPVRGLLTLGGVLEADQLDVPANVAVRGFVPHAAVLPHTAAVVCHGGLSTIMASLCHGVPLLCIPQGREQPLNAQRVQETGVGEMLPADASPDQIAAAVRRLVEDPSYRVAALDMARQIRDCGDRGTDLVLGLLQ